jgi:uncharacterized protein
MQETSKRAAHRAALLLLYLLVFSVSGGGVSEARMQRETLMLRTATAEIPINIEVTETDQDKAVGLMFRTELALDAGMLFPYTPAQEVTMWMKNTYISLDMVFITSDGTVHRIQSRTEPLSETVIASGGPVAAVLELVGGAAEKLGLKPGDKVLHRHFK